MRRHDYNPTCNCEECFPIWMAEAEVEKAAARIRGNERRQKRLALWSELIAHFEGGNQ